MTQEDKKLLLKELCERLPYNVMVQPAGSAVAHKVIGYDKGLVRVDIDVRYDLENVKLYLRPMSSMTEEERNKYLNTFKKSIIGTDEEDGRVWTVDSIDWLNAHHFDYRGLIERGLAIEVNENNNPYKN